MKARHPVGKRVTTAGLGLVAVLCLSGLLAQPALAAGDVNQPSCPAATEESPGFRSYLPDCRAFEMVTPPYEAGVPPQGVQFVSPDGDRRVVTIRAGIAGTEELEDPDGDAYELSRGSSGWNTEPLEPPASLAARSQFVSVSADLSRSLWILSVQAAHGEEVSSATGFNLALREVDPSGEARFVDVGPYSHVPLTEGTQGYGLDFRGASTDLSHILLTDLGGTPGQWPGDATVEGQSLYEYSGTGNTEPVLVGVSNEGPLTGSVARNEDADLVSDCGTILGSSGEGTTYNAVSADGSVVYFTAEHAEGCSAPQPSVSEIYARVDGSATVAISEPTTGPGGDCELCDEAEPKPALFEGASEDGRQVFFLSEQDLLPGAEGESLYEYDFDAPAGDRLTLISPDALGVARISEDGSHVWFVSTSALAAGPDPSLPAGSQAPEPGGDNLYGYDTTDGATSFVATLSEADQEVWKHRDQERPVETTPDGQYLLFASVAPLTYANPGGATQLYEYDSASETLARASGGQTSPAAPAGFGDNGESNAYPGATVIISPGYQERDEPSEPGSRLALSAGGTVVFNSTDALTPGAVDGRTNVYEYREGNVFLVSAGDESPPLEEGYFTNPRPSARIFGLDESGTDIFFLSADQLVPQDVDTQAALYDARTDGGFPGLAQQAPCSGEACQGATQATPVTAVPGSATFDGPTNPATRRKHKRRHHAAKTHSRKKHKRRRHHVKARRKGAHNADRRLARPDHTGRGVR